MTFGTQSMRSRRQVLGAHKPTMVGVLEGERSDIKTNSEQRTLEMQRRQRIGPRGHPASLPVQQVTVWTKAVPERSRAATNYPPQKRVDDGEGCDC